LSISNDFFFQNGEFQVYVNSRENSFTKGNVLHIRPTLTKPAAEDDLYESSEDFNDIPSPVRSARIVTKGAFAFKFGRVELSAKMPAGDWLWPG
jgi:beta-glucanase (GH16 family)